MNHHDGKWLKTTGPILLDSIMQRSLTKLDELCLSEAGTVHYDVFHRSRSRLAVVSQSSFRRGIRVFFLDGIKLAADNRNPLKNHVQHTVKRSKKSLSRMTITLSKRLAQTHSKTTSYWHKVANVNVFRLMTKHRYLSYNYFYCVCMSVTEA